jgi:hypothetical protein
MAEIDPNDSVQNEQFRKSEDTIENVNEEGAIEKEPEASLKIEEPVSNESDSNVSSVEHDPDKESDNNSNSSEEIENNEDSEPNTDSIPVENVVTDNNQAKELETVEAKEGEDIIDSPSIEKHTQKNDTDALVTSNSIEDTKNSVPLDVDFSTKTKEELLDLLKVYLSEYPINSLKKQVDGIKSFFYKLHNAEIDSIRNKFIAEGGQEQDFKVEESPVEITMKELLNEYREKRNELKHTIENNKESNLEAKYEIIENIKELSNSQESLNKTFHDFRELQEQWREIGPVPQSQVKDLWEKYHYQVEAFYDYIKINKELRDLDFKKNLEAKITLCEKAEELLVQSSVVDAFKQLQTLHDQWREIGPVPAEQRSEIWNRFKETTSKINHKHQDYFVNLKEEQKNNLQEKTVLCETAEMLASLKPDNAKEWEEKSKELIQLQKIWKTIGFAPKKYNTKIYERFRAACDGFFNNKRNFFSQNHEEQENNLQLKTELCIQAEALAESTDWKKTTDELIQLQKRWKTIGPVSLKSSDKIWKRFRAACDTFFNRKSKYYANINSTYKENLKLKNDIIKEIENFKVSANIEENLAALKEFQRKWSEIGYVPIKDKDIIQEKYRTVINTIFDKLKLDDEDKSLLKYRSKIESVETKPNADRRLSTEREKCYSKLKQLENDIALWENNIGFFASSKNAESLINDVEQKIKQAKEKIEILQEKLNILNEFDA